MLDAVIESNTMRTFYNQKNIFGLSKITITCLLLFCGLFSFGQLNVTTTRTNATYSTGETANFNVSSSQGGMVNWVLKYDGFAPVISSGAFFLNSNQTRNIPHFSNEAGVVICEVTQASERAVAAAAFSPFDIAPLEEEPADFDNFWNTQKANLASVSSNPSIEFFEANEYSTSYKVSLDIVDGRKVYGYLVVPNGSGTFPAIVELPPYGDVANLASPAVNFAEQAGVMVLSIGIHNVLPEQSAPNAYFPDNYADPYESYYRWAILSGVRAIDYLFTRSDFNGTDLGAVGVSQGAGLATILAGVDNRVKLLAISNPVLSQNAGLKYNRAGGFPNFIKSSRDLFGTAAHEAATVDATKYYDAMFHIRRYNGPVYANLSYEDLITPAATGFATMNQFSGKKILLHSTILDHSHPFEYWVKRQDFLRRVFPSTLTSHPFPYSSNDQGYWVDAGNDQTVSGATVNLSASIKKNFSDNPNFDVKWRKVSGVGNVSFANSNNYNTTATFSEAGTYELEFIGTDDTQLASEKKYFTISDRVQITVGSGNSNNNIPPTVNLLTSSNNVITSFGVIANFSEAVNNFTLSDLDLTNATASNLTGGGSNYTFTVTPIANGTVTVVIPAFQFSDNEGAANSNPSNTLVVDYTATSGGGGCDNLVNLALNKTATQHSSQFNATASRANDGNTNGNFWGGNSVALTNWVSNAWWEIDLGEISEIEEIKIWNRSDCCQSILSNYYVLVSDQPFTAVNLNSTLAQNGVDGFLQGAAAARPSTINVARTGRYVRVQLSGTGFLGLAEVEIMGCSSGGVVIPDNDCTAPANIAPSGSTTQSSVNFSGEAARAIDGNTQGSFWDPIQSVSLTNWENNAWWEIDLGASANIDEVKIWNRTDCCTELLKNYHVLISDEPFVSNNLFTSLNQANVFSNFQTDEAALPSNIPVNRTGRYLRIQLAGQGFLALAEVEIMGCFSTPLVSNPNLLIARPDVLHFEAVKENRAVTLAWTTNTERDNDFFVIEKSADGLNFEVLESVESRSEEQGFHFYKREDEKPFFGKNYYRLLRVTKDGTEMYSEIFELDFDIALDEFSIFPNPAGDEVFVNLKPFLSKDIKIQIVDARGILMLEKEIQNAEEDLEKIDLQKFTNGLYLMVLKVEGRKIITRPLVVSKLY